MIGLLLVDFISKELYFEVFNLSNELIKEVEDVEFVEYTFQKQLRRRMLGSTSKVYNEVIITTNKELMLER
ncbi:TPA: toxin, partial [Enterococcus faecalis]|nr:toxin [Enterococcus faecalis]